MTEELNIDYVNQYFEISPSTDQPEIIKFKREVKQIYRNKMIDQFSYNELIFLADSGIYPIESLDDWLEQSILKPGDYILPATQIKARLWASS